MNDLRKTKAQLINELNDLRQSIDSGNSSSITKYKLGEELASPNSSLLSSIIDSVSDIIFSLDSDYCYTSFNAAHAREMGKVWGVEIELGKRILDYILDDDARKKAKINYDRAMQGERFTLIEDYGEPGNRFIYELKYSPIKDGNNKPAGLILFIKKITDHKQVEEDFSKVSHEMGERVKELRCLYGVTESIRTQDALEEIFQDVANLIPPAWHYPAITRGKVIFDGIEYISEPFTETKWKQSSKLILNGKSRGAVEVYYIEECPILDEGPFMTEERNLIDGIVSNLCDAIEHKQADRALLESEQKYRAITQTANDAIVGSDSNGCIISWNQGASDIFDYADEEILGRPLTKLMPKIYRDRHMKGFERAASGGQHKILGKTVELHGLRKDGNEFPLELAVSTWKNAQQTFFTGIIRDISKRKQAEETREHLVKELLANQDRLKALSSELVRSQEQERRQIARELHDEVGQQLTVAKLRLRKYTSKSGLKDTPKEITETLEYLDDTLAIVRNISLNLHPSILDELGLAAALRWLIDRQIQISDYIIQLELGDFPDSLSEETAITIFRITQEAMNNISRHAQATEVLIKVKPKKGSVIMEISDNGLGFKVDEAINIAVAGGSLGLLSMRERAGFVGGQLDIESSEGGGTIIRGSFPMNN